MFNRTSFLSELAECICCNKQSDPFYFHIRNQRVMLITACPSFQTVSSPLMSVRFVRQMLYALLGEEGVSDEGLSLLFSKKGIYWSHLHKCFNEKFYRRNQDGQYMLQDLPSECTGKYLKNEIELLYKSLKLIIIMGKQTCRNATTYVDEMRNTRNAIGEQIEIIEIDYLQNESPEKYDTLQEKVASALGREMPEKHADSKLLETAKTRMRVGIDMELAVLEKFFNTADSTNDIPNKLDQMWLDRVALPQKKRQAMLITAWSTIESSLTTFLIDALDPRSQKAVEIHSKEWLQDIVNRSRNGLFINSETDFRQLSAVITQSGEFWLMDRFIDQLRFGHIEEYYKITQTTYEIWQNISNKLNILKQVRNIIVHRSGFISNAELDRDEAPLNEGFRRDSKIYLLDSRLSKSELSEINVITNTVYLTAKAPEQILTLTKELLNFIVKLDDYINQ